MTFAGLPYHVRGIMMVFMLGLELLVVLNLMHNIVLKRKGASAAAGFLFLFSYALYQVMCEIHTGDITRIRFPLVPLAVLIIMVSAVTAALLYEGVAWQKHHISAMSVKEAFDKLPAGICYSLPDGRPVLVNTLMQTISRDLFSQEVLDAERFYAALGETGITGRMRGEEAYVSRLSDGRVYSFRRNDLEASGISLRELVAFDVTKESLLTEELLGRQKRALEQNARMRNMQETVEEIAAGRAMLQVRAAVHDELGRCLLVTKRFLLKPGSIDKEEVLSRWRTTMRDLNGEAKPGTEAPGERLKDTAAQLGLRLDVSGSPPGDERLRKIMETAIFTHMINVFRHAHGTKVNAVYEETEGTIGLTLTNDGEIPYDTVKEGGGLGNLRMQTEALGGTMRIESTPRFGLTVTFPTAAERKEQTWHTAL